MEHCYGRYVMMNMEYVIGGALALALIVYLVYALLRPERF
jgi:K+-transporting ATPase KdpF subunit